MTSELLQSQFRLAEWQKEFVDGYLRSSGSRSLLVAAPGTGKTVTALYATQKMLKEKFVDSALIVTDLVAIRDQWVHAANSYKIDLANTIENYLHGDGIAINTQTLRTKSSESVIDDLGRSKRWLIVADDPVFEEKYVSHFVDRLLDLNRESKVLYISRTVPESISFDSEFRFNTEFILQRSIIELPDTEIRVARYAPSFTLLRELERNKSVIDNLSWRNFEKLIASLLEKDGYEIELMQGTKDGGVDVVAVKDMGPSGQFKTLWQAKKMKSGNKVGISVVRELADTRQEFGASKGIIVTSSYMTKGALQRIDRDKYILGKVDRDDLEAWIDDTLFGRKRS